MSTPRFDSNDNLYIWEAIISQTIDVSDLAQEVTLAAVRDVLTATFDQARNLSSQASVFKDPADDTSWFAKIRAELVKQNDPSLYQSLAYSLAQIQSLAYSESVRFKMLNCHSESMNAASLVDLDTAVNAFFSLNANIIVSRNTFPDGAGYSTVITYTTA